LPGIGGDFPVFGLFVHLGSVVGDFWRLIREPPDLGLIGERI
jgi:hypothetical protein